MLPLRTGRRCRSTWVLAVVLFVGCAPAAAAELNSIRLRGGAAPGGGDVDGGAVAVTVAPAESPGWLQWIGEDLHVETAASFWPDAGPNDDVFAVHMGPAWRFHPGLLGSRGFIEAGTSVACVSDQRIEGSDLGSEWHSTSHATLGFLMGRQRRWHAGLRVRHTSNADFGSPNPGLDIVMLEMGYRFDS